MIILDYNAITPIFPEILDEVNHLLKNNFFLNPSSVHTEGKNAKKILEKAKTEILQNFNAKCHEIYFTSGGTESNNMALNFKVFDCIFTLETEHDSILNPVSKLKHKFIKLDENGLVDLRDLATQIKAVSDASASGTTASADLKSAGMMQAPKGAKSLNFSKDVLGLVLPELNLNLKVVNNLIATLKSSGNY